MIRLRVCLTLTLALLLGSGAWLPARGATADSPLPAGLTPAAWQAIQSQVAKLTAADGAGGDEFGYSVSVSSDTAVVGAHWAVNGQQGAAYVFYRNEGGPEAWGQVAKLTAADGAQDEFGRSVSVSGDTAVVGAYYADIGGNVDQGAAYVFYRNQGGADAWGQVAKLTAADGATSDIFGFSVSVSGDTAVVGAHYADIGGNVDQGAAYVFYRNQGGTDAWGQVAKLTAAGATSDIFGFSVSVSGDTAVVGALQADVGGNTNQGAAYVFYHDQGEPDAWGQVAKLTAADGAASDAFGLSVSLDGDTAVVGAGSNEGQGAAYVFYRDQGGPDAWGQAAKLTAADGAFNDEFGVALSVSSDTAVVGAVAADVGGNDKQGAAYVFYRDHGGADAWGQVSKLTANDGTYSDYFGVSVSVSGDTAVIGAFWADVGGNPYQGAAYVYAWPPVAADDAYATPEDTPLLVPAALGVLANDMAPYGAPLTAVLGTDATHGTLDLHADGSFTYTPTVDYAGLDTFTYHANDGVADSNVATVQILVYTHVIYLPLVVRNH